MIRSEIPIRAAIAILTAAAALAAGAPAVTAQDGQTEEDTVSEKKSEFPMPEMSEEQKAMYEKAMQIAGPGPEHELLAGMAGSWDVTGRIWPTPGAATTETTGTAEARMILGGRFLELRTTGGEGSLAADSLAILGFDRRHGHYTLVACDTWGTYYVTAEGHWDEEEEALVLSGTDFDPTMEHLQEYDFVYRFPDGDTWVNEIVFKDPVHTQGKGPHKMVEIVNRRQGE